MRVFHFVIKTRKRALRPDSFFFNDSDICKNILIIIITSLAIHYSQNVFGGFSILVCIGVQVFCVCSADPGLLNETKGSCFPLSCLSSYQNKWSKQTFFYNDINIQIKRFFSKLVESKSCEKYCLKIIRIETNTAFLAFLVGM